MVLLLTICTSTYLHALWPSIMDRNKNGAFGIFWKLARVGERLSPYVSLCCLFMAVSGDTDNALRRGKSVWIANM
jgi:hypothetical protein